MCYSSSDRNNIILKKKNTGNIIQVSLYVNVNLIIMFYNFILLDIEFYAKKMFRTQKCVN